MNTNKGTILSFIVMLCAPISRDLESSAGHVEVVFRNDTDTARDGDADSNSSDREVINDSNHDHVSMRYQVHSADSLGADETLHVVSIDDDSFEAFKASTIIEDPEILERVGDYRNAVRCFRCFPECDFSVLGNKDIRRCGTVLFDLNRPAIPDNVLQAIVPVRCITDSLLQAIVSVGDIPDNMLKAMVQMRHIPDRMLQAIVEDVSDNVLQGIARDITDNTLQAIFLVRDIPVNTLQVIASVSDVPDNMWRVIVSVRDLPDDTWRVIVLARHLPYDALRAIAQVRCISYNTLQAIVSVRDSSDNMLHTVRGIPDDRWRGIVSVRDIGDDTWQAIVKVRGISDNVLQAIVSERDARIERARIERERIERERIERERIERERRRVICDGLKVFGFLLGFVVQGLFSALCFWMSFTKSTYVKNSAPAGIKALVVALGVIILIHAALLLRQQLRLLRRAQ